MSKTVDASVTTKNKKGFVFVSNGLESDGNEIAVKVTVEVPETLEEAASSEFYGSEEETLKVIQQDWSRRCTNTARPLLREAEAELDWESVAQTAIDGYKPGRRGGFTPKVSEEDLEQYDDIDALRAFLRSRGVVKTA